MVFILPEIEGPEGISKTIKGLELEKKKDVPFFLTQLFEMEVKVHLNNFISIKHWKKKKIMIIRSQFQNSKLNMNLKLQQFFKNWE